MQKFSKKSSLALTLCILRAISSSGYAAEKSDMITYSLDEVVVTATKTELTQKENPRSVEVITKEDIQNTGAISVRDALRTATNIDIVSVNHGGGENISIRGGDTDGVLILVNGRRVAGENYFMSQGSNAYALDRLNLSNVDHIEILRGPASAIYGSGAMSGVINIITKKSEKPEFSVGVATGTNEMSNYYHYDTGKNGKVSVNFDVNFSKLRNIDSKAGKNLLHGPKQAYNLNLDYEMDENNNLNLMLDYAKDNLETRMRDFSVSSSAPDDLKYPITSFTSERKTIALTYDGKNSNSDYSLSASYSQLNRDPYAADTPGTNEKKYKSWNIEARDTIRTSDNNKLIFGGEYRGDKASIYSGDNTVKNTDQYSLYLYDEYRVDNKLLLTPAIRYDYHKSFGSHTSPNLGATYFISDKSRFKANYGTSYRAPSVDELYGAFTHGGIWGGMAIVGNPDLKPEKSKGWEISYEQEFGDTTSAKLTYFDNKKEDAISYKIEMASPSQMGKFYNIDSTSSKGVEFEIKHDFGKGFTLVGNYNWLDSVDDTTGERLNYNARNTYMAKLMWTEPIKKEWNITAWNKWYTDFQYDSDTVYSVNTFNFTVTKRWGDKYRVFAGIDNVFNKDLSDMGYYGRLWRVGAEMKF
ncbi:TonB-dependent receptor plug domain-containing protein [Phascolarctobacterium faecium]|uniref:TonB-dependent receptor plug domain-containing protein n=1 Tax=Phascolarctobacterium faecium TaxID=33025 RepID=UPI003AB45050